MKTAEILDALHGRIDELINDREHSRKDLDEALAMIAKLTSKRDAAVCEAKSLRIERDAARDEAAAFADDAQKTHLRENRATMEARSARADAEAWKNQCIQNNEELKRALVAMDAARNERDKANAAVDRLTGAVAAHDAHWAKAADIVGLNESAEPAEILAKMLDLAAGTGPVALPDAENTAFCGNYKGGRGRWCHKLAGHSGEHCTCNHPGICDGCRTEHNKWPNPELGPTPIVIDEPHAGDFKGLQSKVSEHSRALVHVREDIAALRARLHDLQESDDTRRPPRSEVDDLRARVSTIESTLHAFGKAR